MLLVYEIQPHLTVSTGQPSRSVQGYGQTEFVQATLHAVGLARLVQFPARVLADGLKQSVPHLVARGVTWHHHRFVDEASQGLEHHLSRQSFVRTNCLGTLQGETGTKD